MALSIVKNNRCAGKLQLEDVCKLARLSSFSLALTVVLHVVFILVLMAVVLCVVFILVLMTIAMCYFYTCADDCSVVC